MCILLLLVQLLLQLLLLPPPMRLFDLALACLSVCLLAATDRIFVKILPKMYLWIRKSAINSVNYRDPDTGFTLAEVCALQVLLLSLLSIHLNNTHEWHSTICPVGIQLKTKRDLCKSILFSITTGFNERSVNADDVDTDWLQLCSFFSIAYNRQRRILWSVQNTKMTPWWLWPDILTVKN